MVGCVWLLVVVLGDVLVGCCCCGLLMTYLVVVIAGCRGFVCLLCGFDSVWFCLFKLVVLQFCDCCVCLL